MTKIGIFDSGIGGLSILKEIHRLDKKLDIYYIADSLNNPYGLKDQSFVLKRCHELVQLFCELDISHIVIACNTATAWAIDSLRADFPDIQFVGVEPYINIINHRSDFKDKKGAILATPLTGKSQRFLSLKNRFDPKGDLDLITPGNLAPLIEKNFFIKDDISLKIKESLYDAIGKYDFYILGCTHYPLVQDELASILKGEMISPCSSVANRLLSILSHSESGQSETFQFLKTDQDLLWQQLKYSEIFS